MCMYLHIPTAMTFRVFMNGHYYLMDDFFSLYYSWYLEWLFCIYCSPVMVRGKMPVASVYGNVLRFADACFEPGKFHNEWTV